MSRQFVIIPAAAFFDRRLQPIQLRVLGALGYHTDRNGWCNPGVTTMANLTGVTPGTVSKSLTVLESLGIIEVTRNKRRGNRYRVLYERDDDLLADVPTGTSEVPTGTADVPPAGTSDVPAMEEQEREQEREKEYVDDFAKWWALYPRKVSVAHAKKAYLKIRRKGVKAQELLDGLTAALPGWRGKDQKYIPHGATWLNGERWKDGRADDVSAYDDDGEERIEISPGVFLDQL